MKNVLMLFFLLAQVLICMTQEPAEQQIEDLVANEETTDDDTHLLQLEQYRKNHLSLNTADAAALRELTILNELQIENFILYRRMFGELVSIYELQAIPSWDIPTIRKLLPFVSIASSERVAQQLLHRFRGGEHSILFRVSQSFEKNKEPVSAGYNGSPQRIFFRYRYNYKNVLQYGCVGEKDAGETFRHGVDFYSLHFFARKTGIIQAIALGDFTVNMGQGLIQWQGLAFKKSAEAISIKRQSPLLRPHNSAGEFYFHRGAGIQLKKDGLSVGAFVSLRKIGANIVGDSINGNTVSSLLSSGYHRTEAELADRNNLNQQATGISAGYQGKNWQLTLNGVYYHFSIPLQKKEEPYNLFAIEGNNWYNLSIDYSYTNRNIHFFGEAAIDKKNATAFINGILISVDAKADLSFLQRSISAAYQAVYANAFTENTKPSNETGYYAGITIRLFSGWKVDAYADIFSFPWLKSTMDAPGHGTDLLARLSFTPNKQTEIYTRYRYQSGPVNERGAGVTNYLIYPHRQHWRTQVSFKINNALTLRSRIELSWYDKKKTNEASGFLGYTDIIYKPLLRPWSIVLRCQYFETDDYNSRIYAYENDVMYSYSLPAFSGKGFLYYSLLSYDLSKRISLWLRWSQIASAGNLEVNEMLTNTKCEIKLQARYSF